MLLREKNEGITRLFELVDAYVAMGQETKGVDVLAALKRRMFADKKQNEFAVQMDGIGAKHPDSQPMLEFWASALQRAESRIAVFRNPDKAVRRLLGEREIFRKACDTIEKLVDIDAYDHRNQERMAAIARARRRQLS